jgi:hypothetical protein
VSADLVTQLAEYGQYLRAEQEPIAVSEIISREAVPSSDDVIWSPPDVVGRPRWEVVMLAAAAVIVVFVGGVVWLSRSDGRLRDVDQPPVTTDAPATTTPATTTPATTTTLPTSPPAVTLPLSSPGILGPGAWTVAAAFPDGQPAEGALAALVDEVRSWPGVLDVAEAADSAAWRSLTGLDAADCGDGDDAPPCGPGVVVLTVDSSMAQTQIRLRSEFAMTAVTPIDVPRAFLDGYRDAALELASPVPLEFDPSSLGAEQPLRGPLLDLASEDSTGDCQIPLPCDVAVELDVDGVVARTGVAVIEEGSIVQLLPHGSYVDGLLIDRLGRRGVAANLQEAVADRRIYKFAALPLEAAVVTFEQDDGSTVWQRPLAGMALTVDSPGSGVGLEPIDGVEPPPEPRPVGPFLVLDASGTEIMRIEDTPDGILAVDLRVVVAPVESSPRGATSQVGADVTTVATLDGPISVSGGFVETGDAVWLTTFGDGESPVETSAIVRIDTASYAVEKIPVDGIARKVVPTADALWVTTYNGGTLVRIDLQTRTITDTIELPVDVRYGGDIIAADGGLWVTGSTTGYLRVDPATHAIETYPSDEGAASVGEIGGGSWPYTGEWVGEIDGGLWAHSPGAALTRIDLDTGGVERFEFVFGNAEKYAAAAGDSIWLTSWDGEVARFDLESREITDRLNIGAGISMGTFADQGVWVPNGRTGTVSRIDATTAEVTDVIILEPDAGLPLSLFAGSLWFGVGDAGVSRIDVATRQVTEGIVTLGGAELPFDDPRNVVLLPVPTDNALWIASADRTVRRIAIEP